MAKIYKRTDKIKIKIDDVEIKISPLSLDQKTEIQQAMILGRAKGNIREASKGIALAIKYSVKEIKNVLDAENKEYELKFEDNNLTDECVDDLLNLEITEKMTMVCMGLIKNIPSEFTDEKGNKLEGVEIIGTETKNPN